MKPMNSWVRCGHGMPRSSCPNVLLACLALLVSGPVLGLETDRQQPLLINADASDGSMGDGKATLRGNIDIRQGTLLVKAEFAEVEKTDGKVREVMLTGNPVVLQQEIEMQGLVRATARTITYQVATGIVTLSGNADVNHPQYQISGELLVYDMNQQHFQGSGSDENGRIRIQIEPEVIAPLESSPAEKAPAPGSSAGPGAPEESQESENTPASGSNAAH